MPTLETLLKSSRELSWSKFGKKITFYLPGMFVYNNMTGRYPALSITGDHCSLMCDHCRGKILSSMVVANSPELLIEQCKRLEAKGAIGVLISGGCDQRGMLPWDAFLKTIEEVKNSTNLLISVHTGFIDQSRAVEMKMAGVDQALIDVIGDSDTFERIYHLSDGPSQLEKSLEAICKANMDLVPHIVCGLNYGRIQGENNAVSLISRFPVKKLVIVSLMPITGTPTYNAPPPAAEDVVYVIINARQSMPETEISLGCARRRGDRKLEILAVKAGINSMSLPSDEAIQQAETFNLDIRYQKTCCSVSSNLSTSAWS